MKSAVWYFFVLCLAVLVVFENDTAANERPARLLISQSMGVPTHEAGARVLTALYAKMNIDVAFKILPARRSLLSAVNNETDGLVFRIAEIGDLYPNLIRVPTPFMRISGYAYSIDGRIVNSQKELKNLRIGIIRGIVWAERIAKKAHIVYFDDYSAMLGKLFDGGIDVVVSVEHSIQREIKAKNYKNKFYRGRALTEFDLYHYLNIKHKALVDRVDYYLQVMQKSGEFDRLFSNRKQYP
ncbi:substrate-binding periplasmic protein [Sneathiella aquimaris]|uniref:substrate-binding periplasmic protein n=1 Tax=Sneathiella aquimaris TaxID=2599305 RepID=UPI00146B928A|nr:transporter substrate-binding domain-containing protein [Sneathiella aquimaris]